MIPHNERPLNTIRRHLQETQDDLIGWEAELKRIKTQQDMKYKSYCETWVRICKNTIDALEREKANWLGD